MRRCTHSSIIFIFIFFNILYIYIFHYLVACLLLNFIDKQNIFLFWLWIKNYYFIYSAPQPPPPLCFNYIIVIELCVCLSFIFYILFVCSGQPPRDGYTALAQVRRGWHPQIDEFPYNVTARPIQQTIRVLPC